MAKRANTLVCSAITIGMATFGLAQAASPEKAPAACRAQMEAAARTLEGVFGASSLVRAVLAYAPARFHPVDEGTLSAASKGTCPREMALVGGRFCVDRYEGSLVTTDDGGVREHSPYEPPADGETVVARSVPGVVPQGYISAAQAERACRAAGKRLCAPVEWRVACAGSKGNVYPYGTTHRPNACHDTGASPMLALHADTMRKGWGPAELNDPRLNQLEGTVAKTGTYPQCVDDRGVFDMVGNLHEWTADPNGTFQGGYWLDTREHGEGCAYRTIAHGYAYRDYSTGFRCCRDVEVP